MLAPYGASSLIIPLTPADSGGIPLAAIAYDDALLEVAYRKAGDSTWTDITLVSGTLGTYTSSGWVEDANQPALYELGLPAGAINSGSYTLLRVTYDGDVLPIGRIDFTGADATVSSRAPAATALSNATWTDAKAATIPTSGTILTTLGSNAPAGWINANAIAASALDGKGNWLLSTSYTAPDNAGITTAATQATAAASQTAGLSGRLDDIEDAADAAQSAAQAGATDAAEIAAKLPTSNYLAGSNSEDGAVTAEVGVDTEAVAAAVWDNGTRTLSTAGVAAVQDGLATSQAVSDLAGAVDGIDVPTTGEIAAALNGQTITITTPYDTTSQLLTIVRGDSYLNADGRAITFTLDVGTTMPNDISDATVALKYARKYSAASPVSVDGTIATAVGSTKVFRFDLTSEQTEALSLGRLYDFEIEVLLESDSDKPVTPVSGEILVVADMRGS